MYIDHVDLLLPPSNSPYVLYSFLLTSYPHFSLLLIKLWIRWMPPKYILVVNHWCIIILSVAIITKEVWVCLLSSYQLLITPPIGVEPWVALLYCSYWKFVWIDCMQMLAGAMRWCLHQSCHIQCQNSTALLPSTSSNILFNLSSSRFCESYFERLMLDLFTIKYLVLFKLYSLNSYDSLH